MAGQRRDDVDAFFGEEGSGVIKARFEKDREIAAVDHTFPEPPRTPDEMAKVGMHLRCATRDIEGLDAGIAFEQFENPITAAPVEGFRSLRSGFDMTMMTGEVAAKSNVDLNRCDSSARKGCRSSE